MATLLGVLVGCGEAAGDELQTTDDRIHKRACEHKSKREIVAWPDARATYEADVVAVQQHLVELDFALALGRDLTGSR